LREEHRLRVFEKRELRRMFGLKRVEVMGGEKTTSCTPCHLLFG